MSKLNLAPELNAGDAIELSPLVGKVVALMVTNREGRKTKFGDRQMSTVFLMVEGETEPMRGVMFQSYIQSLPLATWFVGKVARHDRSWCLESAGINKATLQKLEKAIAALPADQQPIGEE